MLAREDVIDLVELILDRAELDEHQITKLRQSLSTRDAALRLLRSQEFIQLHQASLADAFGVRADIEPYL